MKRRLILFAVLLGGGLLGWLFAVWPPPIWYRSHWPARTAFMQMRGSRPADSLDYHPVPLDSIAPAMLTAAVIGEDNHFLEHGGVDFQAIRYALGYPRAEYSAWSLRDQSDLVRALVRSWGRRDDVRGGSTITQQLAKNLYLSPSRNPLRKLKEAVTAYRLESALGKRRIMELYLNTVELGDGIWGVDAASRHYFNHPANRLSREEAAALAGSLPFPLSSNPRYHPARMRRRQQLILRRMRGERIEIPEEGE